MVNIPGRYIDPNEQVEAVWTNQKDNQLERGYRCAREWWLHVTVNQAEDQKLEL